MPPSERDGLRDRIGAGTFEYRKVPHSVFSVKGEGVVATLYRSGKFVVQGADPDVFLARYTSGDVQPAAKREVSEAHDEVATLNVVTVGSDETGKGDFFGPLVVAAVRLEPEQVEGVRAAGVMDSKKLTDPRALKLGAWIRSELPFALAVLDPPEYNEVYARYRNLNPMLADLHAEAVGQLSSPGMRVVVDQFGNEKLLRQAMAPSGVELVQAPRGERNPAVAAASIVARQEFLLRLRELSESCGFELAKGAGTPVDRVAVAFARDRGVEALSEVAKTHFRTLDKIRERAGL